MSDKQVPSSASNTVGHDESHHHEHDDHAPDHEHEGDHDHGSGHSHEHFGHHHHHHGATDNIRLAFILNFSFSLIEIVGGLWIGSLAIVADAVHDLGDSVSLGAAYFLERLAKKKKDRQFNFGYRRFSLLSALVSGIVISVGSIFILIESIQRFNRPSAPAGRPMMALALLGLAVNGYAAFSMSRGKTQNEKVLTWHLIEDVLGWTTVLVGAFVIQMTGWTWVDPLLAIGLSLFVMFNVIRYTKSTLYLFLQGRPTNFDEQRFLTRTLAIPGVQHVDHLAVWSLDGESSILSARLHLHSTPDPNAIEDVKVSVRAVALEQGAQATLETCLVEHLTINGQHVSCDANADSEPGTDDSTIK